MEIRKVDSVYGNSHVGILRRHGLTVECRLGGLPENGAKVLGKTEILPGKRIWFGHHFDSQGRLTAVHRDNLLLEEYQYNEKGQRCLQCRRSGFNSSSGRKEERLLYDERGRLTGVNGSTSFEYDERGALAEIISAEGITKLTYGGDTLLDKVQLAGGPTLRYVYAGVHPVRRYRYHTLTGEYQWNAAGRLVTYADYDVQVEYAFTYAADGALDTVRLRYRPLRQQHGEGVDWAAVSADWRHSLWADKAREAVHDVLRFNGGIYKDLTLRCGCDQVGSVRVLLDPRGNVIKEVVYDSFGQRLSDSFPELYVPLGFAGGLHDPDTKLVRFGWRDYDPSVGRFTAPDPKRDMRGDGDLYDYCADDPVSRMDPTGLAWDESLHPRDDIGRFAAAGGGSSGGGAESATVNNSDLPTEEKDTIIEAKNAPATETQDNVVSDKRTFLRKLLDSGLPISSFDYGHPEKIRRIEGAKQAIEPLLKGYPRAHDWRYFDVKNFILQESIKKFGRTQQEKQKK